MSAAEVDVPLRVRFARVLAEVDVIRKDQEAKAEGKFAGYKYANINQVLHMLKPILATHGLALAQPITLIDGHLMVTTELIDVETGEVLSYPGPAFPPKGDPQSAGGAFTYFRRYALVSLFALEAEDDDAAMAQQAAMDPHNRTPAETEVRSMISAMPKDQQSQFIRQFRDALGMGLSDLPPSQHGDALTWSKSWVFVPATGDEQEG